MSAVVRSCATCRYCADEFKFGAARAEAGLTKDRTASTVRWWSDWSTCTRKCCSAMSTFSIAGPARTSPAFAAARATSSPPPRVPIPGTNIIGLLMVETAGRGGRPRTRLIMRAPRSLKRQESSKQDRPSRTRQWTRVNGPASTHAPSCRRRARLRLGREPTEQAREDVATAAPDLVGNGQCLAANGVLAPRDRDIRDFAVVAFQNG